MIKALFMTTVLFFLTACASVERLALPEPALLSPKFGVAAESLQTSVNHSAWDSFLGKYLRQDAQGVNRVAYADVTEADHQRLRTYLSQLEQTDVNSLTRDQQLAFWINVYNAETVDVILQNYPVESIRDITDGGLSFGPWNRVVTTVNGQNLSLNDIEHRIIRPVFNEPRIHYALNCAAVGCPNLMGRAWRARTLEHDLEEAERAYINNPRGVSVGPNGTVTLSKIYIWFQEDFGATEAEVLQRLQQLAEPGLAEALSARSRVRRYVYDWALNDASSGQ